VRQPSHLDSPDPLAPFALYTHEARAGERMKVLRHRLPRDIHAVAQPHERQRPLGAQPRH
jgi:hypothetical protein